MKRMKTYDVPHKGLRNALSQVSLLVGKTNFDDPYEVEALYQLGADVFKVLHIHAADEDEVTLAELEKRCPGCSQNDMNDHLKIHAAQDKLEKMLDLIYEKVKEGKDVTEDGAEFYLAWSEFHSAYLEHAAGEERITQPLLWQHFTDDELAVHRQKIMAKNPPETLLTWFRFVIPAQSHNERVGLLSGFKKMAPTEFFFKGLETIEHFLDEKDFIALNIALAN